MASIEYSFISTVKMTGLPVASACPLGFSGTGLIDGRIDSGMPGSSAAERAADRPVFSGPVTRERVALINDERPTKALAEVAAMSNTYAAAAAGAETKQTQHHTKWAFRGLEPWSDPA
ncbi:hypothetical protein AB0O07_14965 [Streptomyces sp. NPDC093085]|uniref:hypothetical protein n=1 Tax=Streptomyces sp. NPDC093085 TaxID=3155068 RepID=UPI00341CED47